MPLDQQSILAAVKEAKEKGGKKNFAQSIDLILTLRDVDMKSPEAKIQEIVVLPYSLPDKPNKVCVFASGEMTLKARHANADRVIERAELEGLAGKKRELRKLAEECDFFMAEAPLMPLVGKTLGSFLGPRGKMPVPVPPTADVVGLIERYRKTVIARIRGQPIVQVRIGTEKMKEEEITENIQTVLRALEGKLKKGLKNIKIAYIKASMGTPVKIAT